MGELIFGGGVVLVLFFIWRYVRQKKSVPGHRPTGVIVVAHGHAAPRRQSRPPSRRVALFKMLLAVNVFGLICLLASNFLIRLSDDVPWAGMAAIAISLGYLIGVPALGNKTLDGDDRHVILRPMIGLCWLAWACLMIFGNFAWYNDV